MSEFDNIIRLLRDEQGRDKRNDISVIRALEQRGRELFAQVNGWKIAYNSFSIEALIKGKVWSGSKYKGFPAEYFDHQEFFRETAGPHRAVCIVSHLYAGHGNVAEYARRIGLTAHIGDKDHSWYYPTQSVIVAYTRPGVDVIWPWVLQAAAFAMAAAQDDD